MDAFDREIEYLEKQYADGEIDNKEYSNEMRELQRDYRAAMEESCENAYEEEAGRW